jgi:transcriptional regulator with XRE-family HTH domain
VVGELQRIVGCNLRRHREATGLSQEAFAADVLKVHRTYASRLERGKENLTLTSLEWIADRIGLDPVELLTKQ